MVQYADTYKNDSLPVKDFILCHSQRVNNIFSGPTQVVDYGKVEGNGQSSENI